MANLPDDDLATGIATMLTNIAVLQRLVQGFVAAMAASETSNNQQADPALRAEWQGTFDTLLEGAIGLLTIVEKDLHLLQETPYDQSGKIYFQSQCVVYSCWRMMFRALELARLVDRDLSAQITLEFYKALDTD
jgi:hypothetical protein